MTEITVNKVANSHNFWMPRPRPRRYLVDPVAFFVALIGGPLLVTLLTFWAFFIPVFALVLGGPVYLILGTPLLLIYLRQSRGETGRIISMAFFAALAIAPIGLILMLITGEQDIMSVAMMFALFGLIFGPLWASAFGWIYFRLRREFYTHPLPNPY